MQMKINKALIRGFKGISEREITFNADSTDIRGFNGLGKSTIATAIYFVLSDCDYQLNNKPMVQPIGNPEVKPYVKLWLDVDGKEITAEKTQKTVVKTDENSGKTTSTTTNTYAINDVPKAYRDFVQYFKELGIDLDKFLILSHPDAFTKDSSAKGREKMREALFEMASEKSDLEIAKEMTGVSELLGDFQRGYKLDEIKAMNNSTIKRIETENGKNNELIESRIQGLIEGKAEVSIAGITEREMDLKTQISVTEKKIEALKSDDSKELKIRELQAAIRAIEIKAKEEYYTKRNEHLKAHSELIEKFREVESIINLANKHLVEANALVEQDNKKIIELRERYDTEFATQYEHDRKCPTCGQDLPQMMLDNAEQAWDNAKAKRLNDIMAQGDAIGKELERQAAEIADANEQIEKYTPQYEILKEQIEVSAKWNMTEPQASDIPEAVALQGKISALEANTDNLPNNELNSLNETLKSLKNELNEVEGTYRLLENNKAIDVKVSELRNKRMNDETVKANAEKILYQITEFEKFKNNLLTAEINKKFSLVSWKLFDYAKNGEYKEVCIPTYQGKDIGSQTNAALTIAMKIDIATSFQKFWNVYTPIIVDEAERLDSNSRRNIETDSQIVFLTVSDDNELTIEKGV